MALDALSNAQVSVSYQWTASKTRTGYEPQSNSQPAITERVTWSLGTGADSINEIVAYIETVNAGATDDLDMSAAFPNVVGDLAVTIARVKAFSVKLLTASDADSSGNVLGTACSGIVVGAAAANPWLGPFGAATHTLVFGPGDFMLITRRSATGMVVTAGSADTLRIVNSDGAVAAKVRLGFWCAAT